MNSTFEIKLKRYPHFSRKHNFSDVKWVREYCENPDRVGSHAFYPFIHRVDTQRRYRRVKEGVSAKQRSLRVKSKKKREISYANHLDSSIYSYYASILQGNYEDYLGSNSELSNAVLAYRSKDKVNKPSSNIHFAQEVFNYVRKYPQKEFRVLALDVSSFFDNLSHSVIKQAWKDIMGFADGMPKSHYNVYKNITRYSFVDYHEVFKVFEDVHMAKRPSHLKRRDDELLSFCTSPKMFRQRIAKNNLIRTPRDKSTGKRSELGVPQGSPISPMIANLYMLKFDECILEFIKGVGGLYRRYSDDLIFVYPNDCHKDLVRTIHSQLNFHCKTLEIKDEKIQEFYVQKIVGKNSLRLWEINNKECRIASLDYLGLTFDGDAIRLKSASLSKYYRKSKKSVRIAGMYASTTGKRVGKPYLFKSLLYKKHSHLGAKRRLRFKEEVDKVTGEVKRVPEHKRDWGNFLTYGYKAKSILTGRDRCAVKKQLKRHFNNLSLVMEQETKKKRLKSV